jgi:hypothetical protein
MGAWQTSLKGRSMLADNPKRFIVMLTQKGTASALVLPVPKRIN